MKFNLSCRDGACQRDTAAGRGVAVAVTSAMRPARVVLAVAFAVACSDSSGPGALVRLSIEGLVATDTVRALPPEPIVVTVRDSTGRPIAGDAGSLEGLPP